MAHFNQITKRMFDTSRCHKSQVKNDASRHQNLFKTEVDLSYVPVAKCDQAGQLALLQRLGGLSLTQAKALSRSAEQFGASALLLLQNR